MYECYLDRIFLEHTRSTTKCLFPLLENIQCIFGSYQDDWTIIIFIFYMKNATKALTNNLQWPECWDYHRYISSSWRNVIIHNTVWHIKSRFLSATWQWVGMKCVTIGSVIYGATHLSNEDAAEGAAWVCHCSEGRRRKNHSDDVLYWPFVPETQTRVAML